MNIIDYAVVDGYNYPSLVEIVKEWMAEGWQPLGGVQVDFQNFHEDEFPNEKIYAMKRGYIQAMVKYG